MYNEILNGYHDDSHVYIINGQSGPYVSYVPAKDQTSVVGGECDWDICNGIVRDIKQATSLEELQSRPVVPTSEKPKQKVYKRTSNNISKK